MSSTTSPRPLRSNFGSRRFGDERGQILFVFVGGLVAFLGVAALVFDVGQNLLDWRTQRNVADGAALAGARFIAEPTCNATPSLANCPDALNAALRMAATNGYGDGVTNCAAPTSGKGEVCVHIPPINGDLSYRQKGFLEVDIHTDRPSFFAAALGMLHQNVNGFAVAGNSSDVAPPYSMLSLRTDCNPGVEVGGGATVTVTGGSIVSNSCGGQSIWAHGGGTLSAPECDAVGSVSGSGGGTTNCTSKIEGIAGSSDPLGGLQPPPMPPSPPPQVTALLWNGTGSVTQAIPTGCPSSTAIQVVTNGAGAPSTAFAAAASVGLPYFLPGDLAVVHAYRSTNGAAPALPAGWTNVTNGGPNGSTGRVGYRFLLNTDTTTGTWTGATDIQVVVLRGALNTPIGASAAFDSATTTMTTPALSLQVTDQTSWVLAFGGSHATNANTTNLIADSGQPVPTLRSGSDGHLSLHTGEGVNLWTQRDYAPITNTAVSRTVAVEIKAARPNTATAANPIGCSFKGGQANKYNVYRIHPGVYYGGIKLTGTVRVYMEPGTYWIAGGGIDFAGVGAQLISDGGGTGFSWPLNPPEPGRGVLIYNTEDAGFCGTAPGSPCIGQINANGGSDNSCTDATTRWRTTAYPTTDPTPGVRCTWLHLEPNDAPYKNLLLFVDRNLASPGITFNGSTGKMDLSGTIYDPTGEVKINGSADDNVSSQIIAYNFVITGGGGFSVNYNADGVFHLKGSGLVQ